MDGRKFFNKLVIFLLPLAAVSVALDFSLRDAPNSYAFKKSLIDTVGAQAKVLIFGTSQAYYDFDPDQFAEPALNLANVSQSLTLDQQIFDRYAAQFREVKLVVLALSYFSFEYRLYGNEDDYREFLYTRELDVPGDGGWSSWLDLRRYSRLAMYGPELTMKILFRGFGQNLRTEVSGSGWFNADKGQYEHLPITDAAGKGRADYHTSMLETQFTDLNVKAITQLRAHAKLKNAELVLTRPPSFVTYTKALDPAAELRFARDIEALHTTLGLKFFDYMRDSRFEREDFYDNDHLNAQGAAQFSAIFEREVVQPSLQNI